VGNVNNVDELAGILGCGTSSLPLKHLGLPPRACYKAESIWTGIVEKIERRLVSWKKMYLSKGGRVTLIKSTLQLTFILLVSLPHSCWCGKPYRKASTRLFMEWDR
jgi:hypothetical protein